MNSWKIIKNCFVSGRIGEMEYEEAVRKASKVFIIILFQLTDREKALEAYEWDLDIAKMDLCVRG